MQWLNNILNAVEEAHPDGEIVVSSGVSPSGKYHIGTLREVLTADAVLQGLRRRGRQVRHIHVVDDLDGLRKVPAGVLEEYSQYLGRPVCDIPAPDGSDQSYADYFLQDFLENVDALGIDMAVLRSHEKYRAGFFTDAIETTLNKIEDVKKILAELSGRSLPEDWSPIQVNEEGYLKKRSYVSLDSQAKTLTYIDRDGNQQSISYANGDVKLDWRLDWPARWWLLKVNVEPFGRDHAAKGGSYDTGAQLVSKVFGAEPPLPVPYEFINRAGETKKMSKSAGNTVTITELLEVLPAEIVRYFVLRYGADKQLFFDQQVGVMRLIDEYAELLAKPDKTTDDQLLIDLTQAGKRTQIVSNVPFSHLVASYQAALHDKDKTLDIVKRTEHAELAGEQAEIIKAELDYIQNWLDKWAPEEVKFDIVQNPDFAQFSEAQIEFFKGLAKKIAQAPAEADGEWFHKAIYDFKEELGMEPKAMFQSLYKLLINKDNGPRAGWFLSLLERDWLLQRLRFEA